MLEVILFCIVRTEFDMSMWTVLELPNTANNTYCSYVRNTSDIIKMDSEKIKIQITEGEGYVCFCN
jgi:hypothetical protein